MNEYLKKNFGYEVEGDFDTLQEAKTSLEAEQLELKDSYMSAKYIENMLMIETISSLIKAHGETSIVNEESSEFSAKQIKMAFGVLNDPRFKGGDFDGAVAVIEKIAKGLSDHPSVANALRRANESIEEDEDDGMLRRQDGEYDKDEIRAMQYQQNVADPLNREIDASQKAHTIEVDYDLELDKPKSKNPLLKKHYKEMRKFNVFISMPEWQEGPPDSGFGIWTAKVRGSKKNLLGWLKAWEFDYDKEQLADMGLGESVNAVQEADEEKGPEHYRYVSDSQLSHAKDKLEALISELEYAIAYRGENSHKFFNTGDKAGVGSLMSMQSKLEEINDSWDESTELYGM